jgi:hypothetical protein
VALVMLLVTTGVWAQEEPDADAEVHPAQGEIVPVDAGRAPKVASAPLSLDVEGAYVEGRNLHALSPVMAAEVAAADARFEEQFGQVQPGPRRVGLVRPIGPPSLSMDEQWAEHRRLADGRDLWTLAVRSPGAHGLRLHFNRFDLGSASLLVYAWAGDDLIVRGPYSGQGPNGNGDFWTASLPGDTAFVEVTATSSFHLQITEVGHFDQEIAGPVRGNGVHEVDQLPCHLDAMCYEHWAGTITPRQATVKLVFATDGGSKAICSGTILNDLDPETRIPYLLTAYHCLHTQTAADSLEVIWFWQRDSCGGALPSYYSLPRSNGATMLETNPTSGGNDMAFLRLRGDLPPGAGLAGWTTSSPFRVLGIHHPAGSWKRLTFYKDVGVCIGCAFCGDPSDYDFYDFVDGIIEGGSSGSGIFTEGGLLFGQLYGHCCPIADCAGEDLACDNKDEFAAQYGEFETTYPRIRRWLEMGGTVHVDGDYEGEELGTPSEPFDTVGEAYDLAWDGTRLAIRGRGAGFDGSYPESLVLAKRMEVLSAGGVVTIGR